MATRIVTVIKSNRLIRAGFESLSILLIGER